MTRTMPRANRYRGALLGLAVGDALGTTVEFKAPGTFDPVTDMVGGGAFDLPAGAWTDDTSMALCLAESLLKPGGFDPVDQLERYVRWYRHGHWSSTGRCFDIGNSTRQALELFERTHEPCPGDHYPDAAGNGVLMRLAPVALAYAHDPQKATDRALLSARTTHGAPEALDACRYFAGLLVGALAGEPINRLLTDRPYEPVMNAWDRTPLNERIRTVAEGSFIERDPPQIQGSGYVVASLEAALWALHRSDSFEMAVLAAVNLGDDADTTAAVCGQLAGAVYGEQGIPARWRRHLLHSAQIRSLATRLHTLNSALGYQRLTERTAR